MPVDWLNQPEWKGLLEWESLFLNDTFPSQVYHESIWAEWESRIKNGQDAELDRVAQRQAKWEDDLKLRPHGSLPDEIADSFADDAFEASRLTNTMYAALIVSIWSDMEHFLKRVAYTCHRTLGVAGKVPYQFGPLKDFFINNLAIDLASFGEYSRIDAIRILNNSFKHSNGHYKPDANKAHTQIAQPLLDVWDVMDDKWRAAGGGYVIDYAKLPIQELVTACNAFCRELLSVVGAELQSRVFNGN